MCFYDSQPCGNPIFKGPISAGNLQLGKVSLIQEIANIQLTDSILKSRDITLPTKVRLVKSMVFPVVMYGCES